MEAENGTDKKGFEYFAFISYSHKDIRIAKRLKKRLQSYHLPTKLQKIYPTLPKKLGPIFIDEVPHSGDESKECFPPALLELPLEQELLGIDLKKFGERDSFLRAIATMLELNLDNFVSYEARERKRRAMIFTPIATALMMIMGGLIWYSIEYFNFMQADDAVTQFNLGVVHHSKHDYAKAFEYYQKAASQGYVSAQNNIGSMYAEGLGVKQDYDKAREWYQKAAAQGFAVAQDNIGYMYMNGLGVERDYVKAMEWYQKAAAQGYATAQNNIGYLYLNGLGVPQSNDKAIEYFTKAAEQGHKGAKTELEKLSR